MGWNLWAWTAWSDLGKVWPSTFWLDSIGSKISTSLILIRIAIMKWFTCSFVGCCWKFHVSRGKRDGLVVDAPPTCNASSYPCCPNRYYIICPKNSHFGELLVSIVALTGTRYHWKGQCMSSLHVAACHIISLSNVRILLDVTQLMHQLVLPSAFDAIHLCLT